MASKNVKKKAPTKIAVKGSGASSSKITAPKPAAVKAETPPSSVVPFAPLMNPLAGIAPSDFSNFNPSIAGFSGLDGTYESMENAMNDYKKQYEKMSNDATATVREGVETLTKSSATFQKGAEQIMKTLAELAQESSQRNAEAMKSLMTCRTLNEFADAQNKLAQQNFDDAMSTMTKLSEMAIKMCTEAFDPINGQMTKAMTSAMKKNAA